jgi:hypothetical protein
VKKKKNSKNSKRASTSSSRLSLLVKQKESGLVSGLDVDKYPNQEEEGEQLKDDGVQSPEEVAEKNEIFEKKKPSAWSHQTTTSVDNNSSNNNNSNYHKQDNAKSPSKGSINSGVSLKNKLLIEEELYNASGKDSDLPILEHHLADLNVNDDDSVNINCKPYDAQRTPLHNAAFCGAVACAEFLIQWGANVDEQDYVKKICICYFSFLELMNTL